MSHAGWLARLPGMKVVILGAGYAGITAAIRLARKSRGQARVTLVNATDRFVERIRLHERAGGRTPKARSIAALLEGSGVELVIGRAIAVDSDARTVTVADLSDAGEVTEARIAWDRLVLALGSRPDTRHPGVREHALTLDVAGAELLAARLPGLAAERARVVVVGGGLTGIEAATEIAESWPELDVTILSHDTIGADFSVAARRHFAAVLDRLGVHVRARASAVRVERDHVVTRSAAEDENVPFDLCLWTVGVVGASLPAGLSLATNARGQVLVDPSLRSISEPAIYVAGDLAAHAAPRAIPIPMGCKSAGPTGAHVADNLHAELFSRPLAPLDFAAPLYCVSLGRRDGVVQRTRADGSLTGPILRGRLAAWVKEIICKSTITAFALERYGLSSYAVFRTGNVPSLPSLPSRSAHGSLEGKALGS